MSRSGYTDDNDNDWQLIRWRGAVASAFRGRRGQAFLREMLAALDALPEKKLIAHELIDNIYDGSVCALGAVGRARGLDMDRIDPECHEGVANEFDVAHAMACEIMWANDDGGRWNETPTERFNRVRRWVESKLIEWDSP